MKVILRLVVMGCIFVLVSVAMGPLWTLALCVPLSFLAYYMGIKDVR